ncbi:IclR family transcriptional regulator [Aliiruegeria lutimaris]|uniref:Transcriptional regulator, IclR family n=1 Tax=Aliiruegeria lutimaris TaxID=571298 RepID=A0A1G8IJ76_9RHOB|nr:IclR family transcriptional regulator [Aliiruegeria lutimaris]SDI18882.1 transcriptional regulator, IclR family [Aliiruegeria lutimaris]
MPIIQSVQRALQILDLYDEATPELKITEISNRLGLHKSTLHALLKTLQEQGYIDQNAENGKYRLGLKLVERGTLVVNSIDLRGRANPFLAALSRRTGKTTHLGILDGRDGVYFDKIEGRGELIAYSRIGRRLPVHCTAIGKSLLAWRPLEEVRNLLMDHSFSAETENTISGLDAFLAELGKVRAQGFALDEEELRNGVLCVAAPIFDHAGHVAAAASLSTLTLDTTRRQFDALIPEVRDCARAISEAIGRG